MHGIKVYNTQKTPLALLRVLVAFRSNSIHTIAMGFLPRKLVNRLSRKEDLPPIEKTSFRIGDIRAKQPLGLVLRIIGPLLDRIFGTHKLHTMFHAYKLWNYDGLSFLEQFIPATGVKYRFEGKGLERIPDSGKTLMIGNHPHGGIEGVILSYALASRRDDYKLFVNIMLYFIKELARFFIFTNPMLPGSVSNARAIRKAQQWLKDEHCLIIFPAGRVGLYRSSRGYITDESWDRMALSLCINTDTPVYPVFINGQCSPAFSWSSRLFFPMKLLMLVNEFLKSFHRTITFFTGQPVYPDEIRKMSRVQANAYLRMRTYLLAPLSKDGLGTVTKEQGTAGKAGANSSLITKWSPESPEGSELHKYFITLDSERLLPNTGITETLNFWSLDEASNQKTLEAGKHFSILLLLKPYPESFGCSLKAALVTAHWLYRYLQPNNQGKNKIRKGSMLYPKPLVRSLRHPPLRLHREVEWYFNRHLPDTKNLEATLSAIEERGVSLPGNITDLRGYNAVGMSHDEEGYPVLLLVHTLEK